MAEHPEHLIQVWTPQHEHVRKNLLPASGNESCAEQSQYVCLIQLQVIKDKWSHRPKTEAINRLELGLFTLIFRFPRKFNVAAPKFLVPSKILMVSMRVRIVSWARSAVRMSRTT